MMYKRGCSSSYIEDENINIEMLRLKKDFVSTILHLVVDIIFQFGNLSMDIILLLLILYN